MYFKRISIARLDCKCANKRQKREYLNLDNVFFFVRIANAITNTIRIFYMLTTENSIEHDVGCTLHNRCTSEYSSLNLV